VSRIFAENLDKDHVDQIKSFFESLDADGDGVVTLQEFKEGMQTMSPDMNLEQIEVIFSNIDMDDSRGISLVAILLGV